MSVGLISLFIYVASHLGGQQLLPLSTNERVQLQRLNYFFAATAMLCLLGIFLFQQKAQEFLAFLLGAMLYKFLCVLTMRSIRLRVLLDEVTEEKLAYDQDVIFNKRLDFLVESGDLKIVEHKVFMAKDKFYFFDLLLRTWAKILKKNE